MEHWGVWAQSASGYALVRLSGSGAAMLCLACVGFFLGWAARPSWMTVWLERPAEDGMS